MIVVNDLRKTYEGRVPTQALRGLTFTVADGEFIAVMGRSGSGKSTLLHQLGLLDRPTSGSIEIDGVDVLAMREHERSHYRLATLGYVFQEYALIGELTALENVHLPARTLGKEPARTSEERAEELLALVGLSARGDHFPSELSGGEQQRVAIARSLMNRPRILFADEPTANLDSAAAKEVVELFRRINRETGQTIIMVTHEPDDRKFVRRVITLKDGRIEKDVRARSSRAAP